MKKRNKIYLKHKKAMRLFISDLKEKSLLSKFKAIFFFRDRKIISAKIV